MRHFTKEFTTQEISDVRSEQKQVGSSFMTDYIFLDMRTEEAYMSVQVNGFHYDNKRPIFMRTSTKNKIH